MKYYFDVVETFVRTIAVEANDPIQAELRARNAYKREEFEIDREHPDVIGFQHVTTEVEKFFQTGDCAEEEIETFDCTNVVYDEEQDCYVCPVCGEYAADRWQIKDLDYPLPKHCHECGAKLHY